MKRPNQTVDFQQTVRRFSPTLLSSSIPKFPPVSYPKNTFLGRVGGLIELAFGDCLLRLQQFDRSRIFGDSFGHALPLF